MLPFDTLVCLLRYLRFAIRAKRRHMISARCRFDFSDVIDAIDGWQLSIIHVATLFSFFCRLRRALSSVSRLFFDAPLRFFANCTNIMVISHIRTRRRPSSPRDISMPPALCRHYFRRVIISRYFATDMRDFLSLIFMLI